MQNSLRNSDFLDASKLVLILMVLAIHCNISLVVLGIDIATPVFRTAVPLFFLMSSYFFWVRIQNAKVDDCRTALKRFVAKKLQLYAFWFIVLLPITLYIRYGWWLCGNPIKCVGLFFVSLLLNSTFFASWFIMALVISVSIVVYLSQRISDCFLLIVGVVAYCFCCLCSTYAPIFHSLRGIPVCRAVMLLSPTSFLAAFVWVVFAKIIAKQDIRQRHKIISGIMSLFVCVIEFFMVKLSGVSVGDCYLSLLLVAPTIFILIKDLNIVVPFARSFRSMSTLLYVLHGSVLVVLDLVFLKYSFYTRGLKFIGCCSICIVSWIIIKRFQAIGKWEVLKWAC